VLAQSTTPIQPRNFTDQLQRAALHAAIAQTHEADGCNILSHSQGHSSTGALSALLRLCAIVSGHAELERSA
jgi:hypothetical protein